MVLRFLCVLGSLAILRAQDSPTPPVSAKSEATSLNMGLGAIVPHGQPYRPLTAEERWHLWAKNNFANPRAYAASLVLTLPQHFDNSPPEWGEGPGGYVRRAGSRYSRFTISSSITHSMAGLLGHDPRYVPSKSKNPVRRIAHAFVYEYFTYDRHGRTVFHISNMAGQFGSEAIASTWYPGRNVKDQILSGIGEQILFSWFSNIAREFAPEIKRIVKKRKKTPTGLGSTPSATGSNTPAGKQP